MTTVSVLSGVERRRRWSASQKAQIVAESLAAGAVVTEVARRHDVHPNLLRHWRRRVRQGSAESRPLGFLPMAVSGDGSPTRRSGTIEIELGGVVVRVDSAVDEAALGRVLRVVGR
ncbi:MAG: transposase [Gammaproteobacteria bacterium]